MRRTYQQECHSCEELVPISRDRNPVCHCESGIRRTKQPLAVPILLVALIWCPVLLADSTWVAGEVWGTWGPQGNPYLVMDNLTIPHDSTLNILPGVQIYFQNQQIRRTPINVLGRLRAVGAEGDSVYFYSPTAAFGGINNEETPGTETRLEYTVIDSTFEKIASSYGSAVIRHSRICGFLQLFTGLSDTDTIQYSYFHSYWFDECHIDFMGGTALFQNNWGPSIYLNSSGTSMAPIIGNQISMIYLVGGLVTEIFDNSFETVQCENNNSLWHENEISDFCRVTGGNPVFEHSTFTGYIQVMGGNSLLQENEIYGSVCLYECSATVQKNLIVSTNTGFNYSIQILGGGSNSIEANTIIFDDEGIYALSIVNYNQIVDNIFVGDGVNCTGVYCGSPADVNIRYNDFYQVNTVTYNCQLGPGNILLDPCFRAGNPYDYQLQANSPCIDAGDPTSPLDPDGTRADIGCYFFDHRIDNPPAIISPTVVNVQRGTTFRYIARATDDFGPLYFGFWNLPAWLYRVPDLMDFQQKAAVVQGRVPQGQGNFTFGVWVEDGSAQRDSQLVSVLVSPYTILAGEVTGVLTAANSPYLAVQDVVVPAGDSLTIEPGVEIRFQWEPLEDLRHRIVVRGKFHAVGTPTDSIHFLPEYGDSLAAAWRGIWCLNPVDTAYIEYAYFLNAGYGVRVDSEGLAVLNHSSFQNTEYYAVNVSRRSWIGIDSCDFHDPDSEWGDFLHVDSSSATVMNSYFEYPDSAEYMMTFGFYYSTGLIQGCTFVGRNNVQFNMYSEVDVVRNRIRGNIIAFGYYNGASGVFANNIMTGGGPGLNVVSYVPLVESILICNNVFHSLNLGILWNNPAHEGHLKNNIFLGNRVGIRDYDASSPFTDIEYNDFFANDTNYVRCIPESTNLFVDPMVHDTVNFQLSAGSPCINAGDPDPFFNDADSTRNDIGCWGGPWGESYQYEHAISHLTKPIPTEFALLPPYPNPFNSVLIIPFTIPVEKEVTINIYNILGQKVQEYTFPPLSPGVHKVFWNSGSCASGLYIIHLISGGKGLNQKVLLLK